MKAKFAPRPWIVERTERGGFWVNEEGLDGFSVCYLIGHEDAKEKAHLISAAPEMLAALIDSVRYLKSIDTDPTSLEAAEHALAKATGGEG